jgi:hypothetical protein
MAARRQQDLEHLLRARAPEVARTELLSAILDRQRSEEPNCEAMPRLVFSVHLLLPF